MEKQLQRHEGNAYNRDIIAMTMPLFLMAFFYYGPRPLLLALAAVLTAKLTDRFASVLRGRVYDKTENSSVAFALIIVLMMPATVRFRVVVAAVIIAVLVAKEAFGGYNSYPFNPAAVGFCVAAVSWPAEIFRYPPPQNWLLNRQASFGELWQMWTFQNINLVEGPSSVLKAGGTPNLDIWQLMMGDYAGALGVTAALVLGACAVYLIVKKRLPLAAPFFFLLTSGLFAFFIPRIPGTPWEMTFVTGVLHRLNSVKFELMSGALLFAVVFLVDEPGTLPKNTLSRIIYGSLLGLATMLFRHFGTYELGTCFALLLVNAVSGYFDRAISRGAAPRGRVSAAAHKEQTVHKKEVAEP